MNKIMVIMILIPMMFEAYAVSLNTDIIFNTSESATSMTFKELNASADEIVLGESSISLKNISYINGELEANITSDINLSLINHNTDIAMLPNIIISEARRKTIANDVPIVNATIIFSARDCRIKSISYISANNNYNADYPVWACISNRLLLNVTGIESNTSTSFNIIDIAYSDDIPIGGNTGGVIHIIPPYEAIAKNITIQNITISALEEIKRKTKDYYILPLIILLLLCLLMIRRRRIMIKRRKQQEARKTNYEGD